MSTTNTPLHWRDINFKDKSAIITALISFALGWVLLFAGFCVPPMGDISASVLTGFGTALLYTAGAFGIVMYVKTNNQEIYSNLAERVDAIITDKLKQHK